MKSLVIGAVIFSSWSAFSTWAYVCKIKGLCDEPIVASVIEDIPVEPIQPLEETEESMSEPEPVIVSPDDITVHHPYDEATISDNEQLSKYATDLLEYMRANPDAIITVTGYADSKGTEQYNYNLGLERANQVRNKLIEDGIYETSIVVKSQGENSPAAENSSELNRAKNRRTEISINN